MPKIGTRQSLPRGEQVMVNKIFCFFFFLLYSHPQPSQIGSRTTTMLRISTLNTRIGGSSTFLNPLRTTTLAKGRQQPLITPRHLLRQSPTAINTNTFSTSVRCAAAIEKKALNKKITLPKDPYLLSEKVVKFSKNGKLDDAITLVMESPKSRQNEIVWNHLIQESSKLGKINQSWQLLNDVKCCLFVFVFIYKDQG